MKRCLIFLCWHCKDSKINRFWLYETEFYRILQCFRKINMYLIFIINHKYIYSWFIFIFYRFVNKLKYDNTITFISYIIFIIIQIYFLLNNCMRLVLYFEGKPIPEMMLKCFGSKQTFDSSDSSVAKLSGQIISQTVIVSFVVSR